MADELFQRYQCDRDDRTFDRLVEAHTPLVASVCRRLLRDPNDVDDVVQDTFVKLAGNIDVVSGSVSAWLAATARAASVDLIRRESRQRSRRRGLAESGGPRQVEQLAARETIRMRLHEAMLAIEPAARSLIDERFVRNRPLGVLAVKLRVSVPTAHRRAADAVRQLADVLRALGVPAATDRAVADQLGDELVLDHPDLRDHGELRFAPDWRSAALTPFGAAAPAQPAALLPGWTRPLRVGVMISYNSTVLESVSRTYIGTKWQVHSTAFMPSAGLKLVGVVEPGTVHRGVVESTLRDYGIMGGLIEADDETALSSLDVLLLGLNRWMTAPVARAINRAVRGGVGLLNEFWTASMVGRDDQAEVRELMLAASDVYKYHMPNQECGIGLLPATVTREHSLLPGLKAGTRLMLRGCGPAYKVIPGAQVLVTKDHIVQPAEHGMTALGSIQMPCYILGQLGRGRVAVVHAWPHQWFSRHLSIGHEAYFLNLINWLATTERK